MAQPSRDSLVSAVYARLGDSSGFYTETEVECALNGALAELGLITGCFRGSAVLTAWPDRTFYRTPPPVEYPLVVEVAGKRLIRSSAANLFLLERDWRKLTGQMPSVWCTVGASMLLIVPAPPSHTAIRVEGLVRPPRISDEPLSIPDELVPLTIELAWHRLVMREGGAVFAAASLAMEQVSVRLKELLAWKQAKLARYRSLVKTSPSE